MPVFQALDKNYGYSLDRIDSTKGYTKDNMNVYCVFDGKELHNIFQKQEDAEKYVDQYLRPSGEWWEDYNFRIESWPCL